MSGMPKYNFEENFRRIKRQKKLKFVVVEGVDDVPIYESILSYFIQDEIDYDIIHSEGKKNIKTFHQENPNLENCFYIVDKDFDDTRLPMNNVVFLNRYSIENFFFCDDVIRSVVAVSFRVKERDALGLLNLDEFFEHVNPILKDLFYKIFYYQTVRAEQINIDGEETNSWSSTFISDDRMWTLSEEKINTLELKLYPQGVDINIINEHLAQCEVQFQGFENSFPCKMLKVSLQRYLRDKAISINKKFSGKFNDTETTSTLIMSHLYKSKALKENIEPAIVFLQSNN